MIYLNGRKNNYNKFNTITSIIFIYLFLLFQNINCIIEIPLEIITTKKLPIKYDNNNYKSRFNTRYSNSKIFIEEGVTKINSQHLFLANIKIGSKSQIFRLILDTGSSLTWVADSQIQIDGSTKISNKFDPNSSSSCQRLYEAFNIKYGTGSCSGFYYIDTIKYINNKEFKLKFGVAKTANFDFTEADGLIGLSRTNNDLRTSFISMLYESKIIHSKIFSLKFASNSLDIPMGKLYIGEHEDFSKKNSFSCDLLDNNYGNSYYWTCELKYFALENSNSKASTNHSIPIIFDTGTNYIFLPYEYLKEMEKDLDNVGCKIIEFEEDTKEKNLNKNQLQYRLACHTSNLPEFQFVVGNTAFTLPSSLTFYFYRNMAYSYILFIINNNEVNPYIFGSPFFMSFHTLFNDQGKKLEFYPLDSRYILKNKKKIKIKYPLIILTVISLWAFLIYLIYLCIKWKKEKINEEYESIIPHDINIEMSNK